MSILFHISSPSLCSQHPEEAQSNKGFLVTGWVLYMARTKICGYGQRCSTDILPAAWAPASLFLPLSCLQLPCPATSPLLPLRPQRARTELDTMVQWHSHPAFGWVPFPFPLLESDTGEQLDLERMP